MSVVCELREYLKVSGDPRDDRNKMFRSLVLSRMNKIIDSEDTDVHDLNIDGKDCTKEWRKCLSELETKMSFELEFVFTYESYVKYDKDGEIVDNMLFALADELDQMPDSFLEDHQYIYHYMEDCAYNDAGELRAYRKESDLLQRGDLVEFEPVSASSIRGNWYTSLTVLSLEEDEVPQNDDFLLFEEAFGMLYNYWDIGAEDVKTGTYYLVHGDFLKDEVDFTKAMNALMAVYLTSFAENETMSYEFVSEDELSMLRVTFDLAEKTINYELAKA